MNANKTEGGNWTEAAEDTNASVVRDPESYSLVCACCNDDVEYKKFDDFLQHARKQHLPENTHSELNTSNRTGPLSHVALKLCLTTENVEPNAPSDPATTKQVDSLNDYTTYYDLRRITRAGLVNFINLYQKCLCLWHQTTRMHSSPHDRFCAYYLLLSKLRQYHAQVTLKDVRYIVRQLVKNFEMDIMHPKTPRLGEDMSKHFLQPTKSRSIINKLMFLTESHCNIDALKINRVCNFCYLEFCTYKSLWLHMINSHMPSNYIFGSNEGESPAFQSCHSKRKRDHSSMSDCDNNNRQETSDNCVPGDISRRPMRRRVNVRKASGSSKSKNSPIGNYLIRTRLSLLIEFIEQFETLECLWKENSNLFRNQNVRNDAIMSLVLAQRRLLPKSIEVNSTFIITLIKEIKQHYQSYKAGTMKPNLIKYEMIWKRLRFLEANPVVNNPNNGTTCTQCNITFKTMKNFNLHMLRYHPPTQCNKCSTDFCTADDLKEHLMCRHAVDEQCPLCYQDIEAGGDVPLKTHLSNHFFDHSCITCGKVFHDPQALYEHSKNCSYDMHLICTHCSEVFNDMSKFYEHSWEMHCDNRPFKCDTCHICFKYLPALTNHYCPRRLAIKR